MYAIRSYYDCIFLPVDYDYYVSVSKRIKAILHTVSPVVEEGGIDEAYLDVTESGESTEASYNFV